MNLLGSIDQYDDAGNKLRSELEDIFRFYDSCEKADKAVKLILSDREEEGPGMKPRSGWNSI